MSEIKTAANVTLIPAKEQEQSVFVGKKTRVAAYCRVSTGDDEQLNSFATQISYYTDFICSRPDWELVGIFADEGISGTQTENRMEFNKMIKLCRRKKIDLILCKSISRFARNTVDCLDCVRELKRLGVGVIFEKENINTLSISSEFAITLYASFAQAESESISRNITWGIEKAFREGKVRYQMRQTLGYRLIDGVPVIVENEAETVKKIFQLFADGVGMQQIAKRLTDEGAVRRNGDTVWDRYTVNAVLKNEKYVGDAVLQKTYTVNCLTHERAKNNGQKPKYLVQNCHEPIIDRELWERVQLELSRRSAAAKHGARPIRYHTEYALSELLFCGCCGANYRRVKWQSKGKRYVVWRCRNRLDGGKERCDSPTVHENRLHELIVKAINAAFAEHSTKPDTYLHDIQTEIMTNEREICGVSERLDELTKQRESMLEDLTSLSFEVLGENLKNLHTEEKALNCRLDELKTENDDFRFKIHKVSVAMQLSGDISEFDDKIVRKVVERIMVERDREIAVEIVGGVNIRVSGG